MEILPLVSIVLEALIALIALLAAVRGRAYLLGFTVTFGIYVYYDLARYLSWVVSESLLSTVFFVATLAALASMIGVFKSKSS
jgi:hypothetical protein